MLENVRAKPWEDNENSPNSPGRRTLAAHMLRELAAPWNGGESVKCVIARVSKAIGMEFWRTSDLWYCKTRRVEDFEIEIMDRALTKKKDLEFANELSELRVRFARLEARLDKTDSEFFEPSIVAHRYALGRSR
jgi:hypothetical protein